jgi:ABC-2 type transport system ATP-binding protein
MPATNEQAMIVTRGLTRSFGKTEAVNGLDLDVRAGEIYGFLGPNGAGKTTTIRMLAGLLRPSAGTLHIGGLDPRVDPRGVRALSGLVPDTPPLYEYLSGREYIGFVASLYGLSATDRDARGERFLEVFDLAGRADELCKGYSHGMRKKLHMAAILTTRPRVLLLDEPTSGLDPASARRLKDVLVEARSQGTAVFLSTHLLPTAEELCDRVGILVQGRLRAEGTMEELRGRGGDGSLEEIFLRLTRDTDDERAES